MCIRDRFVATHRSNALAESFEDGMEVTLAGRLMNRRIMGKASFAVLQDSAGTAQLYLNRDEMCPGEDKSMYNDVFKKLLDRGDFIGVQGTTFTTKTGEQSVKVKSLTVLSKSLKPLPSVKVDEDGKVHDAFTCLLYTSPSPRDRQKSRMPSSA